MSTAVVSQGSAGLHLARRKTTLYAAWAVAVAAMLGAFFWFTSLCSPFTIDDAFISLRYADNFVQGHGLVYNPGERVEGYTNFLWVLLLAGIHALGGDLLAWSKIMGAAANLTTLVIVGYAARRYWPRSGFLWLFPPLLLVVNWGFILWGVGGLETSLFTCLAAGGLLLLIREAQRVTIGFPAAALLFALAVLTRPDATVLFAGSMLGWVVWSLLQHRSARGAPVLHSAKAALARYWRTWLAHLALFGAVVAAQTLFRFLYYGDWVPNTAYLKMGPETVFIPHWNGLLDWLKSWQLVDPAVFGDLVDARSDLVRVAVAVLANPVIWLALAGLWAWRRQSHAWVLGGAWAAWFVYLWAVYDDWMPGWRYYVPLLPVVALLAASGLHAAVERASRVNGAGVRAVLRLALLAVAIAPILTSLAEFRNRMPLVPAIASIVETYRVSALYLRAHTAPTEILVMGDAGALPYYSGLPTVDYAGLADKHMARVPLRPATVDKGDGVIRHYQRMRYDTDYLLSRNASFVQLSGLLKPGGGFVAHYPEAVLVYQALQRDGRYDLANPVVYDEKTQLILVKRKDAIWHP